VDSGFGNSIYWNVTVVTIIIHFTTLHHINQRLVFSVRYHFRLRTLSVFLCHFSVSISRTSFLLVCKIKVTLRLAVSQSVSLGVELMTSYLLLIDSYGLVFWGVFSDEGTGLSFV
jgi:hypothetical protein